MKNEIRTIASKITLQLAAILILLTALPGAAQTQSVLDGFNLNANGIGKLMDK